MSSAGSFGVAWPEFNDGIPYHDTISRSHAGQTLIHFYSTKHKSSAPLQGWLQRIENGQVSVDGEVATDPDMVLRGGAKLVYRRMSWKEPDAPYLLQVLYEDDDLIALNKPSGLQVLPGGLFQQRTVLMQLLWRSSQSGELVPVQESHPIPVHRLGRGTSGVLLCAKTKLAKVRLAACFAGATSVLRSNRVMNLQPEKERGITKVYRALTSGIIERDEIVINQPIGMIRYPGVASGVYVALCSGKPALSKVTVLERNMQKNETLVQVEIQSGRPHQIRIHLAFIGYPLLAVPVPNSHLNVAWDRRMYSTRGCFHRVIHITAPLPSPLKMINED
ncbi:hypothetical protein AKJ16_DCAP03283, partial [Drosera capensis]